MEGGEYVKKSFVFLLATLLFAIVPSVTQAQSLFSKPGNLFNKIGISNLLSNITTEAQTEVVTQEEPVQPENTAITDSEEQAAGEITSASPLLTVNLLGVNLNLLGLDSSNNQSLLSLDLNDPLKIDQQPSEDTMNGGSLLNVGLNLPAVGDVNLDLLSNGVQSDSGVGLSSTSGLLDLGINDSMLLGNLNLDVLSQKQDNQGNESQGLATIDLDNMLGNTHVGVIEENTTVSGEDTTSLSGLVVVDTKDSVAGDAHIGVGEVTKTETPASTETDAGLIHVSVDNSITGDTEIGVINSQQKETSDGKTVSGSLAAVDTQDSPVGDVHVGVGEVTQTKTADSTETDTGLVHVGLDNPVTGETQIDVLDSQVKETNEGTTVSGGVVTVDTNDSPIGDTHIGVGEVNEETPAPADNNKPTSPTTQADTQAPADSTPVQETPAPQESTPVQENPTPTESTPVQENPAPTEETTAPVQTTIPEETTKNDTTSEKETTTEEFNQMDGSVDSQNAGIELTANVLPVTDVVQNNQAQEQNAASTELKKDIGAAGNDSANSPVQVTEPAGSSTTTAGSGGSGSGTGGSSSSGGGFAMSMYLGNEYQREIDLQNQVQSILKELSDEWIKAPPIEPPKAAFFLSK